VNRATPLSALDRETDGRVAPIALVPSVGATWALVCGVVASGALHWQGAALLRVLATWLVADATLGCVLVQLLALKRAALTQSPVSGEASQANLVIPYAAAGSPGWRMAQRINAYIGQWRGRVWPLYGRRAVTAIIATGLALILATYLGREMLAAVSGGLFVVALETVFVGRDEVRLARWIGGLHLALAWALGHLALAPWRAPSLGLAALMGLNAYARIAQGDEPQSRLARWLLWGTWGILVMVLLMARQPLIAALVTVGALAERLFAGVSAPYESMASRLGWRVAMFLAALAVNYWTP
jgi:hypothetical protein